MKQFNYLTTKELAKEIGRPVSTIQRWTRMRVIPQIRAGWRTRLYDPSAVRRALEKLSVTEV
ncbi:MAG: helix-turn-helix domain-containing protein [Chthoniobacterales bacterium]|nr:helix-turn-helix domain-containing protein [Chthoniobacterales bacterium]